MKKYHLLTGMQDLLPEELSIWQALESVLREWIALFVKDGEIVAAPVLALSLSFDHRQIDGATGQNAMNHIKRLLNNPELLLMEG